MPPREYKKIAIVQSNYIPWRGYFDLINSVDEFILYDDVQYTKRDWRNRNLIKTANGPLWLTIPVEVKGKFTQDVKDTVIADASWAKKHWSSLTVSYSKTPGFQEYQSVFEKTYLNQNKKFLSEVNREFIELICGLLGIKTKISLSMDYKFKKGEKNDQLIQLCLAAKATEYFSGPAALSYLDEKQFSNQGVKLSIFDYSGYQEYTQRFPPFDGKVSVVDLLFNQGTNASQYLKSFESGLKKAA